MVPGRPTPEPGRSGMAIVAIMKNEARHIQDWLRFHAFGGVRDFFLYDDGSDDGTPDLACGLAGLNVTVLPWRMSTQFVAPDTSFSRQLLAYCHAIENFGGAFRWMAFIDIDECIVPKSTNTILEVLDGLEAFTNVSLPWAMFGPNGHNTPPDEPAQFAYTTRSEMRSGPFLNFKCIVDPVDVKLARVHRFQTYTMGSHSANDVGVIAHIRNRTRPDFLSTSKLQLNHYQTRSLDELQDKLTKGAVSGAPVDRKRAAAERRLAFIAATSVKDASAVKFLNRHGVRDPLGFVSTQFGPVVDAIREA